MAVDLSIKRVPEALVTRLRKRARQNNRSLQGELMAILQEALHVERTSPVKSRTGYVRKPNATSVEYSRARDVAPASEAALMIREDRDGRTFTVNDLFEYVRSLDAGTPDESTAWIRKARRSR